jgi:hypothetical protein
VTRHARQRALAAAGALVLAAATTVGAFQRQWPYALVLAFGVLVLTEAALRADRRHRREVAEHRWARERGAGMDPAPLWPCCLLSEASRGQAHSPACTCDLTTRRFLAIVMRPDDH